jgi:predicted DNA-binding transcriptional regulator AlpA
MKMTRSAFGDVTPAADRLLTVQEAADRLGRSEASLRFQMHKKSAPPHAKIMGRVFFRESELAAWIDAQFEAAS